MEGNRDLAKAAVVFTSYKNNVVALAHQAAPSASLEISFLARGSGFAKKREGQMRFGGTHSHPTKVGKKAAS
jgi:hypothetical protein